MDLEALEPFPRLSTERLELQPLAVDHAAEVLHLFGDESVVRYHDVPLMRRPVEALQYISEMMLRREQRLGIRWAITTRGGRQFVGMVGLNCISTQARRCTLGYELQRRHWGQGFATEAGDAAVRFAHCRLGVHRVEAAVLPENAASLRVLSKLRFVDEGLLRALGYWAGRYHNLRVLSKLPADYEEPIASEHRQADRA